MSRVFTVSVVVPTRDRVEYLKSCVESLARQSHPIDELVIVDSSVGRETEEFVKKLRPPFKVVYIRERVGTAKARNLGIEAASGDIVIFTDDDVVLDRDYVKEVLKIFAAGRGKVGGVGGMLIVEGEGDGGRSLRLLPTYVFNLAFLRGSWRRGAVLPSGFPTRFPDTLSIVEHLDTSNAAFRREVLKEFRFDERLEELSRYAMWEALDFSYGVSRKYLLVINPRAKAIHRRAPTSRVDYLQYNRVYVYNLYYIVKKHKLSRLAFWWSIFGLLLKHAIRGILWKEDRIRFRGLVEGIREIVK
ncbi:MAG: glycosyltransferase family 2 protein [Pyrobaculum sp.]